MTARGIFVILVIALLSVPGHAQSAPDAVLQPGDTIQILVNENEALSGRFAVRQDGSIGSPFYSSVLVAGVPLPQVEEQVRNHVSRYTQNPMLIVDGFFQVAVGGEVRQPGVYGLGLGATLSEAVLRAGGVNERGAMNRVILYRDGQTHNIDLTRPDATMGGMPIQSGDQLVVRQRRDFFRNYLVPVATITGAVAAVINAMN